VPRQSCEVCGGAFYAPPIQIIRGGGKFCSVPCRTKFMASRPATFPRGNHRRGRGGKRADLGDIYFRSSWEANYARYLNWIMARGEIERWEYEPDTFEFPVKRGSKFYTPDFKLFRDSSHSYVEVKGYMDARSATKLRRMARYFPKERVDIVRKADMQAIRASVGRMLPMWENNGLALDRVMRALTDRFEA